jgi:Sulfotransferase domain
MGLDVIGAGFGRTGTLSLKAALEELGFGPCYHQYELVWSS